MAQNTSELGAHEYAGAAGAAAGFKGDKNAGVKEGSNSWAQIAAGLLQALAPYILNALKALGKYVMSGLQKLPSALKGCKSCTICGDLGDAKPNPTKPSNPKRDERKDPADPSKGKPQFIDYPEPFRESPQKKKPSEPKKRRSSAISIPEAFDPNVKSKRWSRSVSQIVARRA